MDVFLPFRWTISCHCYGARGIDAQRPCTTPDLHGSGPAGDQANPIGERPTQHARHTGEAFGTPMSTLTAASDPRTARSWSIAPPAPQPRRRAPRCGPLRAVVHSQRLAEVVER